MKKSLFILGLVVVGIFIICEIAGGDIIHLTDGRKIEGEVIEETEETVKVKMKLGEITLRKSKITKREKGKPTFQVYQEKVKKLKPMEENLATEYVKLAQWCQKNDMKEEMNELCEKAVTILPDGKITGWARKLLSSHKEKERKKPHLKEKLIYMIANQKEIKNLGMIRLDFFIYVNRSATEAELRSICESIIAKQKKNKPHNDIRFSFYLSGTRCIGEYTAGEAVWAPNGKLADADKVKTGDYSQHKLVVKSGNYRDGSIFDPSKLIIMSKILESKRRKIYYDLVALWDKGIEDKSYQIIAKRYGLTEKAVYCIQAEAETYGWPEPGDEEKGWVKRCPWEDDNKK